MVSSVFIVTKKVKNQKIKEALGAVGNKIWIYCFAIFKICFQKYCILNNLLIGTVDT